jgi:hypothetical protein
MITEIRNNTEIAGFVEVIARVPDSTAQMIEDPIGNFKESNSARMMSRPRTYIPHPPQPLHVNHH